LFRQARIPAGPINRIDEVVNDAAMRERGVFYNVSRHGSAIPQVGTAIRIDGQANYPRLPPPGLGEHTEELLKTLLGYDESRLAGLRQRAVII
jgi:crotonobetainyl-CoA:carnitine CoA-transferase CaiB-like acyl-CoA transferase